MYYSLLADVIDTLHLGYVLYVIIGQLLIFVGVAVGWQAIRNPWFRYTHLAMMVIVAIEVIFNITCPLTDWAVDLRKAVGLTPKEGTFIGNMANEWLFYEAPPEVFLIGYLTFAFLVIGSFFVAPPRRTRLSITTQVALVHWVIGLAFVMMMRDTIIEDVRGNRSPPVSFPLGVLILIDGTLWWWLGRGLQPKPDVVTPTSVEPETQLVAR